MAVTRERFEQGTTNQRYRDRRTRREERVQPDGPAIVARAA